MSVQTCSVNCAQVVTCLYVSVVATAVTLKEPQNVIKQHGHKLELTMATLDWSSVTAPQPTSYVAQPKPRDGAKGRAPVIPDSVLKKKQKVSGGPEQARQTARCTLFATTNGGQKHVIGSFTPDSLEVP